MKELNLTVADLKRLWVLAANHAENSKEGSTKQNIYLELSKKLLKASKK